MEEKMGTVPAQACDDLCNDEITYDEFLNRWVAMVCTQFPNMGHSSFLRMAHQIRQSMQHEGHPYLTQSHLDFVDRIADELSELHDHTAKPTRSMIFDSLERSCELESDFTRQGEKIDWLLERLPNKKVALGLFNHMCLTGSEHLGKYIFWIQDKGIHDFEAWKDYPGWASINAPRAGEINVPTLRRTAHATPQLDPTVASLYPDLQEALDRAREHYAFSTSEKIVNELAAQIISNQGLYQHVALLGPTGVGKTQTAELLHGILKAMDVVGPGCVTYSPAKDAKSHVNENETYVAELINDLKEEGGILFVDEAGTLFESSTNPNDTRNFRQRSMQSILSQWDDLLNNKILVIWAGYREGFEKFMSTDAGWYRRIQLFDIDPPSIDVITQFVVEHLRNDGYELSDRFDENVQWLFNSLREEDTTAFGYWGTAENFIAYVRAAAGANSNVLYSGPSTLKSLGYKDFAHAADRLGYKRRDIQNRWLGQLVAMPTFGAHDIPDTAGEFITRVVEDQGRDF